MPPYNHAPYMPQIQILFAIYPNGGSYYILHKLYIKLLQYNKA